MQDHAGVQQRRATGMTRLPRDRASSTSLSVCSDWMLRVRLHAPRSLIGKSLLLSLYLHPVDEPVPLGNRPLGDQPDDI